MTRSDFIRMSGATAVLTAGGDAFAVLGEPDYAALQREVDAVSPQDYQRYLSGGPVDKAAFARLDAAFGKVLKEVKETSVSTRPAVWFLYNMGVIVKTKASCFSVDLMHRRAVELAPLLDFALITHNHDDHYSLDFYRAMDKAGKTVGNNFACNYGAYSTGAVGGYTRARKAFRIGDVEIKTALADHNGYLIDFTSTFEISVDGLRLFHSGDCSNIEKLEPLSEPDLWFVHPRCGLKVEDGVKKFSPKRTVIAHINELGHGKWRWTWQDGLMEKAKVEKAGGAAVLPCWGERIV